MSVSCISAVSGCFIVSFLKIISLFSHVHWDFSCLIQELNRFSISSIRLFNPSPNAIYNKLKNNWIVQIKWFSFSSIKIARCLKNTPKVSPHVHGYVSFLIGFCSCVMNDLHVTSQCSELKALEAFQTITTWPTGLASSEQLSSRACRCCLQLHPPALISYRHWPPRMFQ